MIKKMIVNEIPNEVIIHRIFPFLSENDLIRVASVSNKWTFSKIARLDEIWKSKFERRKGLSKIDQKGMKLVMKEKTIYRKFKKLRFHEEFLRKEIQKLVPPLKSNEDGVKQAKILAVGDVGVGKTCLLMIFSGQGFPYDYVEMKVDGLNKDVKCEEEEKGFVNFAFWERYENHEDEDDSRRKLQYAECNVILICYSIFDDDSFDNVVLKWEGEVRRFCALAPIILVATKIDLRENRSLKEESYDREYGREPISTKKGEKLAKEIGALAFFEVSSRSDGGVKDCFDTIVDVTIHPERYFNVPLPPKGKGDGGCIIQ